MSLRRELIVASLALFTLSGCTDWNQKLREECDRIAQLKIYDRTQWDAYVAETTARNPLQPLDQKPRSGPHNVLPRWDTESFVVTNDWVRKGRPDWDENRIHRNDHYVLSRANNFIVAKAINLRVSTPSFGHTRSLDCIFNYPELYDDL